MNPTLKLVLVLCIGMGHVWVQPSQGQQQWRINNNGLGGGGQFPQQQQQQWEGRNRNVGIGRGGFGSCACGREYQPFCGTNEVTYSNLCELQCETRRIPGLRVKFEGVCALPYVHIDPGQQEQERGGASGQRQRDPFRPQSPPPRRPVQPPFQGQIPQRPAQPPPPFNTNPGFISPQQPQRPPFNTNPGFISPQQPQRPPFNTNPGFISPGFPGRVRI